MRYKHLSQIERSQIHSLMKAQHTITQIAELLGRHKSTVSRELRRNAGFLGNCPKQVCELALKRSESSRNASTIAWVKEQAKALLQLQWSPEQIAGQLPVSHETLYQHVYAQQKHGGDLRKNLHCQKQKKKRYASGRNRRRKISNRRSLSGRAARIANRMQIGHWECDTVTEANHKQVIVTVVERKSGYTVVAEVSNKPADLIGAAIIDMLKPFEARLKTVTYDNGKEFCSHTKIDEALSRTGYFARAFASWERGSNENFNGLLWQYVPKKRLLENVTDEEIKVIENGLNNRSRKRLGFKTPAEVFDQSLSCVALCA